MIPTLLALEVPYILKTNNKLFWVYLMLSLLISKYNIVKGGLYMFGYGYGYGGGEWIWIVLIIFIVFFLFFNNNTCHNGHHGGCL